MREINNNNQKWIYESILSSSISHITIQFQLYLIICIFKPLKKGIMFFTPSLGLSVCVCVCVCVCVSVYHHICGEMAGLSNMVSSEVNTIYKNLKMQHYSWWSVSVSVSYRPSEQNHILACNFKTYGRIHTKFYLYVVQLGGYHVCCGLWDQ